MIGVCLVIYVMDYVDYDIVWFKMWKVYVE